MRNVLSKAVQWGWLDQNPFDRFNETPFMDRNVRTRYLTREEIVKLLEVSPVYLKNVIKAAILTGLRRSDLFKMKWSGINLETGLLRYWEHKKNKESYKQLNDDMIDLLIKIPKGASDYIFMGRDGEPIRDIRRCFRNALKRAGIKDFHFHDLRHTSASHLLMRGGNESRPGAPGAYKNYDDSEVCPFEQRVSSPRG